MQPLTVPGNLCLAHLQWLSTHKPKNQKNKKTKKQKTKKNKKKQKDKTQHSASDPLPLGVCNLVFFVFFWFFCFLVFWFLVFLVFWFFGFLVFACPTSSATTDSAWQSLLGTSAMAIHTQTKKPKKQKNKKPKKQKTKKQKTKKPKKQKNKKPKKPKKQKKQKNKKNKKNKKTRPNTLHLTPSPWGVQSWFFLFFWFFGFLVSWFFWFFCFFGLCVDSPDLAHGSELFFCVLEGFWPNCKKPWKKPKNKKFRPMSPARPLPDLAHGSELFCFFPLLFECFSCEDAFITVPLKKMRVSTICTPAPPRPNCKKNHGKNQNSLMTYIMD